MPRTFYVKYGGSGLAPTTRDGAAPSIGWLVQNVPLSADYISIIEDSLDREIVENYDYSGAPTNIGINATLIASDSSNISKPIIRVSSVLWLHRGVQPTVVNGLEIHSSATNVIETLADNEGIYNCDFIFENSATKQAIVIGGSDNHVEGCTFRGNFYDVGYAASIAISNLNYNTIIRNNIFYLDNSTDAINLFQTSSVSILVNNIFDNVTSAINDNGISAVSASMTNYNCYGNISMVNPLFSGANDVIADPLFIDAVNGNFTLSAGSPCLSAGLSGQTIGNSGYVGYVDPTDFAPTSPSSPSGIYLNYSNMPNSYITKCTGSKYNNERELYDIMVTEVYNKFGVCMNYYITTYDTNYNRIFGEDNNRRFVRKFNFMAYFTLPREEKLWSKFGITNMDQFSMYVAKRHFRTASTYDSTQTYVDSFFSYIPQIGDIIMADYAKNVYEIVEVKESEGNYLLSKQHIWEFIVRPFRDEHISVPDSVSATMPEMTKYADRTTDILDTRSTVETKITDIKYEPKTNEKPPVNPFW